MFSKSTKLLTKQSIFKYWSDNMSTLSKYIRTMALDDFKLLNYRTLKLYLPWRGKPTTLYSDVLAVRAFVTHENGKPVDRDKEDIERKLIDEHKKKLSINDKVLPDPIDLKESRTGEEASIKI